MIIARENRVNNFILNKAHSDSPTTFTKFFEGEKKEGECVILSEVSESERSRRIYPHKTKSACEKEKSDSSTPTVLRRFPLRMTL